MYNLVLYKVFFELETYRNIAIFSKMYYGGFMSEIRENWFKRYGVHTIIASLLSAIIVVWGACHVGKHITNKVSEAQLLSSLVPAFTSKDENAQELAYYIVRNKLDAKTAIEVGNVLGKKLAIRDSGRELMDTIILYEDTTSGTNKITLNIPDTAKSFAENTVTFYQNDRAVIHLDKPYNISVKEFTVDKMNILNRPNLDETFNYMGKTIKINKIQQQIGLLVTSSGAEGPVLMGVKCIVLD